MKSTTTIALICFVLLPSISTDASQGLQLRNPQELQGPCLATLIHQFRQHRIASPTDNRILFASEKHSFNGSANDLNRFLRQIADLPRSESLSVFFTGPKGDIAGVPLTPDAAQSPYDYDGRVHVLQGNITISIPLASRISFAMIRVPVPLRVDVDAGVPRIASVFARLHNKDIAQHNDAQDELCVATTTL